MSSAGSNNEADRLAALYRYQVLDTLPEQAYDDITHLAAQICQTPIASVSFIDHDRQWLKSKVGPLSNTTPREISFCAQALLEHELFVVPDTHTDARFVNNPLVQGDPHIRFYAGALLYTPDDQALGTLCVIDTKPHSLSEEQGQALVALARQVIAQLELRLHVERLRDSEQRFTAFMDNSPTVAFIKDADGRMLYVNAPFERRFHMTEADWRDRLDTELWPAEQAAQIRANDLLVLDGTGTMQVLEQVPGADGQLTYWRSFKFPLEAGGRQLLGGMALDITESVIHQRHLEALQQQLEASNLELSHQSMTDPLTGVANRRGFQRYLDEAFIQARQTATPLALIVIDVDQFKAYNDAFGHPAGDAVLTHIGHLLSTQCRSSNLVARIGGEEFAVVLPDTELAHAGVVAERLRTAIEQATWGNRAMTISLGIAILRPAMRQSADLIAEADIALYRAKEQGRNRTCTMP